MRRFPAISAFSAAALLSLYPGSSWAQEAAPKPPAKPPPEADRAAEADFLSRFSSDTSLQIDAGRYGGKMKSGFLSFSEEVGYDHGGIVASLNVPYVLQRSRGNVVRVGGKVVRVGGKAQHAPKTDGGLGDLLLDGGYYVLEAHDEVPYVLVEGEIKFPTADDERGLGTGSYDETIRVNSGMTLWQHLKLSLDLGYSFLGQPEDIPVSQTDFHNTVNVDVGAGYKFSPSNILSAKFEYSTPIVHHTPPYELLLLEWEHFFKNDSRLLISVGPGLTTSSPGISFEVSSLPRNAGRDRAAVAAFSPRALRAALASGFGSSAGLKPAAPGSRSVLKPPWIPPCGWWRR